MFMLLVAALVVREPERLPDAAHWASNALRRLPPAEAIAKSAHPPV